MGQNLLYMAEGQGVMASGAKHSVPENEDGFVAERSSLMTVSSLPALCSSRVLSHGLKADEKQ